MNQKVFRTIDGLGLVIKNRKSAVIFEIDQGHNIAGHKFSLKFTSETFKELLEHIETVSNKSWSNIIPKEANSMGADYWEYYDREFDNNGYLSIRNNVLSIKRPWLDSNKLYQFNKRKMESFIYDFRKLVNP